MSILGELTGSILFFLIRMKTILEYRWTAFRRKNKSMKTLMAKSQVAM
jgi:hypothetical protein